MNLLFAASSAEREELGDTPNPLHAGGVGLGPRESPITMVNLANTWVFPRRLLNGSIDPAVRPETRLIKR